MARARPVFFLPVTKGHTLLPLYTGCGSMPNGDTLASAGQEKRLGPDVEADPLYPENA